ncbi:MAG TPA: hypothetical protein VGR48_20220 [Terriglobales bacterium]|nr:hypothetical protein [Terriglobales bacterium]
MTELRPVHDNYEQPQERLVVRKGREPNLEQLQQVEASTPASGMAGVPVSSIWGTLRDYIFWNYERGSIHYDIMVTLILLFIFVTPIFVNFKDKPVEHSPHPTAIVVVSEGQGGLVYQVPVTDVPGSNDAAVRRELLRIITPISGKASISKYEKALNAAGEPVYEVWVKK